MKQLNVPSSFSQMLSPSYRATKCGHFTKWCGRVFVYEQSVFVRMPLNRSGSVDYCLECWAKMATRCAWCGNPIFIGDPITLLIWTKQTAIPKYAVVYNRAHQEVVGCLSTACSDTGADHAGYWLPNPDKIGQGYVRHL